MAVTSPWDKSQVKMFFETVRKEFGPTWNLVGRTLREAMLACEYVRVVTSHPSVSFTGAELRALWTAMLQEAKLTDNEESTQ